MTCSCTGVAAVQAPKTCIQMQIDGIELMSELLQNESWSHIPIIGEHAHPPYSCFIWTDSFAGKRLQ